MSETTNLKLLKHDNVETNTEMFDIENYLNGNFDKIDENVGKTNTDISNIKKEQETQNTNIEENNSKIEELQNEKLKLEKELKEVQEDFYQASVRGQASGEYIHVEDSSNCRAKIGISGNSEQETREGYNQFKTNTSSRTVNGVTVTKNNDSSISFSGTTTAGFTVQLVNYNDLEITKKKYLRNYGTLENANFIVQLIRNGKTSVEYVPIRPDVTLNAGDIIQKIYVQQQLTGKTVSGTLDILLTDYENKDKGYEQYGAMPSLDYPSSIKAVGSNVNIFDENDVTKKSWINANGGLDNNDVWNTSGFIKVGAGSNVAFSVETDSESCQVIIAQYNSSKEFISKKQINNSLKDTVELTSNTNYIKFGYRNDKNLSNIKLTEGTEAGGYSKKGQGSIEIIKCNENILQTGNIRLSGMSGVTIEKISETKYKFNGTVTRDGRLLADTYKINMTDAFCFANRVISGSVTGNTRFILYEGNDSWNVMYDSGTNGTINLGKITIDKYQLGIYAKQGIVFNNAIIEFYLERGYPSVLTSQKSQTFSVPTQAEMLEGDYFDFDNEEEVHVWKKLVLDGTEDWNLDDTYKGITQFSLSANALFIDDNLARIMSNYFKGVKFNLSWTIDNCITIKSSDKIRIMTSKYTTVEELKSYLKSLYDAGTPVVIYYILATPNRLKFTDEQKVVAKELNNARTYKNVTNITTDSKAILSLDYAKDQETQNQKMQNEIDEIKQLLSTTQTSAMLLDNLQKEVESEVE